MLIYVLSKFENYVIKKMHLVLRKSTVVGRILAVLEKGVQIWVITN